MCTSCRAVLIYYMHLRLKRFDPQFWLPLLTLVWGIISVCQGLVTNQASLFGIRFLLGVTEAGLFPGCVYLFSVYYRRFVSNISDSKWYRGAHNFVARHERHWRVATFFGAAALAGAFGGMSRLLTLYPAFAIPLNAFYLSISVVLHHRSSPRRSPVFSDVSLSFHSSASSLRFLSPYLFPALIPSSTL